MNDLELEFNKYFNLYLYNNKYLSYHNSHSKDYQKLVDMGKEIIPFLLKRINEDWLAPILLKDITKESPFDSTIPEENYAGRFDLITEAWVEWGKKNGY